MNKSACSAVISQPGGREQKDDTMFHNKDIKCKVVIKLKILHDINVSFVHCVTIV